jgi:uncharacterized OB-fold protein
VHEAPPKLAEPISGLLIGQGSQAVTLAGSRCRDCGEVVFPALLDCPLCVRSDVMEPYVLAGHGVVRDFVVAERGPAGFAVPYVQSWVRLDDGPVIFSIIDCDDPRAFTGPRGRPVTLIPASFADGSFIGWRAVLDGWAAA